MKQADILMVCRKRWRECRLRVFALGLRASQLEKETAALTALLARFRISAHQVTCIPY